MNLLSIIFKELELEEYGTSLKELELEDSHHTQYSL